jgi:hypothetical protein
MPNRVAIEFTDLLDVLEARIATALGLDPRLVFTTIQDDVGVVGVAPAPLFVSLHPGVLRQRGTAGRPPWASVPFSVDPGMAAGAGRQFVGVSGSLQIKQWIQFHPDTPGFDSAWVKDRSIGAFKQLQKLLNALHLYDPTNSAGDYMLQEPMRCGGWDSSPFRWSEMGKGEYASFGKLESDFSVLYLQLLA